MIDSDLMNLVTTGKMKSGNNYGTGIILVHPQTKKILMGERTDNHLMATPGGKVELGESPLQGILRETLEESNIKVNSANLYDYRVHSSENGKNWVSFMFISDDFDDSNIKNQESEFGPLDWYDLEEIQNMDLFPPTETSIDRAVGLGLLGDLNPDTQHYIPFVDCGSTVCNAKDTCPCEYSYREPDIIFGTPEESSTTGMPIWD